CTTCLARCKGSAESGNSLSTAAHRSTPAAQEILAFSLTSVGVESAGSSTSRRAWPSEVSVSAIFWMRLWSPCKLISPLSTATLKIPITILRFRGIISPPSQQQRDTPECSAKSNWPAAGPMQSGNWGHSQQRLKSQQPLPAQPPTAIRAPRLLRTRPASRRNVARDRLQKYLQSGGSPPHRAAVLPPTIQARLKAAKIAAPGLLQQPVAARSGTDSSKSACSPRFRLSRDEC